MKNNVFKTAAVVTALIMMILTAALVSCGNRQSFDFSHTFRKAIIAMPDGTIISGKVDSWMDFEDGDQIQVVIDGNTYLTHISNVVLIES